MTPQELTGLYAALGAAQLNHEKVESDYPAAQVALAAAQAALTVATAARQPAFDAVQSAQAAVTAAHTALLADARAFHTAHNAALVASGAEKIGVTGAPGT